MFTDTVVYSIIRAVPMLSNHIVPVILKVGINCSLIYISAASDCSLFFYIISKLETVFGLSMAALFFLLINRIKQSKKLPNVLTYIIFSIILVIFVSFFCIETVGGYLRNLKEQTLEIISPCISQKEKARLNSFWSRMENREDYKIFYFRIAEYAKRDDEVNRGYSRFAARHNFEIRIRGGSK